MAEPFLGEISPIAFTFAPRNWAFCNGQTLAIIQNEALFSIIGTTYGGDGMTTFQLPDLRGRAIVHNGPNYSIGQKGGVEGVTLNANTMPAHTHVPQCSKEVGTVRKPTGAAWAGYGATLYKGNGSSPNAVMANTLVPATGGSQPHSNLQPYLCIPFIICLVGIFPSRN
jgi:microcystin-dependent protein